MLPYLVTGPATELEIDVAIVDMEGAPVVALAKLAKLAELPLLSPLPFMAPPASPAPFPATGVPSLTTPLALAAAEADEDCARVTVSKKKPMASLNSCIFVVDFRPGEDEVDGWE